MSKIKGIMNSCLTQSSISPSSYSLSPTSFQHQQQQQQQQLQQQQLQQIQQPMIYARGLDQFYDQQSGPTHMDFSSQAATGIDLESLLVNTRLTDSNLMLESPVAPIEPTPSPNMVDSMVSTAQASGDDESSVVNNNINPMFLFKSGSNDMPYMRPASNSLSRVQAGNGKYRNINPNKIDEEQDESRWIFVSLIWGFYFSHFFTVFKWESEPTAADDNQHE